MDFKRHNRINKSKKAFKFKGLLYFLGLCWIKIWWRRRESNPRPKTFNPSVYMLFLEFESRLMRLLQAGCAIGQPTDIRRSGRRRTGSTIPLVDALYRICRRGPGRTVAALGSYGVGIIVCDYVYPHQDLRADRTLGMQLEYHCPRRNRFAPNFKLIAHS